MIRDNAYWAINKASWATGRIANPAAAAAAAGRTILRVRTDERDAASHPVHLPRSHVRGVERLTAERPRHFADTVLVQPKERVEIGFVAPQGDWMLHCHVLEHLEYGMMGYVRVAA